MTGEKYFSVSIDIDIDDFRINPFFGSSFRAIQTDDIKIAKKLVKDIVRLVNKYEGLGCHIGR